MNEHNQVICINFVNSDDHEEIENILKNLQHRYKIHSYEEMELYYPELYHLSLLSPSFIHKLQGHSPG